MSLSVQRGVRRSKPKRVGADSWITAPFTATFEDERLRLVLEVDVADGHPICTSYRVDRLDGGGLELMTTEVLRGFKLRALMAEACILSVVVPVPGAKEGTAFAVKTKDAIPVEVIESVLGTLKRRRAPVTDERLREVADAYKKRYEPGGMEQFAKSLNASERQVWRLIRLARERGFLPRREEDQR